MFTSDWHIHTSASHDATLSISTLLESVKKEGIDRFGITDHANFNIPSFWENMDESKRLFDENKTKGFYFGAELTVIPKLMYDHMAKTGTREGYVSTVPISGYEFEFMLSERDIAHYKMSFTVAAAHSPWHVDVTDQKTLLKEWHRQQMYIATDKRVDILGHPWWYNYLQGAIWIDDFSLIPYSMHDELASALIQNDCRLEANADMVFGTRWSERFYRLYNEFLRYMFEKGVGITYGSDSHGPEYSVKREKVNEALSRVGFKKGDFTTPKMRVF